MKRALTALGMALLTSLLAASLAMGSGYNPTESTSTAGTVIGGYTRAADTPIYTTNPHGNYSSATNKCKTCHAVHRATGTYKLLASGTDVNSACDYCHVGAGAHTNKLVYGYAGVAPTAVNNGHTISGSAVTIPDNNTNATTILVCNKCHSVHGAKTIGFGDGKRMILRNNPLDDTSTPVPDTSTAFSGASLTVVAFCEKCHDSNSGSQSHPFVSTPDSQTAWSGSPLCSSCHNAQGEPHAAVQNGYKMLMGRDTGANIASSNLDDACRRCHLDASGTQGVGSTF